MSLLPKDTYTSGEIGRLCGIPARTARRYLLQGTIPAEQNPITGRWRVEREAIVEFLRQHGLDTSHLEQARPRQVMVIDDEEWVVSFVRETLETSGLPVQVESFTDSHLAFIRLGSCTPDLIVLDLRMPKVDGAQVLAAVRAHKDTRIVPVLVISGFPGDYTALGRHLHLHFLAKPFSDTDLLDKVRGILAL